MATSHEREDDREQHRGRDKDDNRSVAEIEIQKDIEFIKDQLDDIKERLNDNFVTRNEFDPKNFVRREEFDPVKKLVYGFVVLICAGVVTAILALVIKK